MAGEPVARHQLARIRHETRRRMLDVREVVRLTPGMQRIRFVSPELHDFVSAAPDDHVKLFFPDPADPGASVMRDYTPRAFRPDLGELTIDFALHEAGPATAWAIRAAPGDRLEIGGPRGSAVVPDDFDWYLLVGDETALPAIGRWVEGLRPGVPVTTIVAIEDPADAQHLATRAEWRPVWLARSGRAGDDAALLRAALDEHVLPPGDGFVWIAAEARTARSLRTYVIETRGHPKAWSKASGYWIRGEAGASEKLQD